MRDPNERPDEADTIGPPDDGGPATQEPRYEEAELLAPEAGAESTGQAPS